MTSNENENDTINEPLIDDTVDEVFSAAVRKIYIIRSNTVLYDFRVTICFLVSLFGDHGDVIVACLCMKPCHLLL